MRFVKSIKFRLTMWYLAILGALLLAFGATAYFALSRSLYQSLDDSLKLGTVDLEDSLDVEDGNLVLNYEDQLGLSEQPVDMILLYNDKGQLIWSWGRKWEIPQIDTLTDEALGGESLYTTSEAASGQEIRLYVTPVEAEPAIHAVAVVGRSMDELKSVLRGFRRNLIFAALAMIGLASAGGLFLAKRAFKPVEQITRTAQGIEESDLSRRIEVNSEDELGRLASTLNQMIGRLERAFSRQRQFTADASHELRTPLSVIKAESTLALRKKRAESDYRKSLELISREVSRMSTLVDRLLFLARSDAGRGQLNFEEVNLKELLSDLAQEVEVLCQEKRLQFKLGPLENLIVRGDKLELKQLFFNLLDNAIKYTPSGGIVSVSAVRKGESAVIAIRDSGIGIPEEHIPHIFERFYRVDKARSRAEGGAGLGLSICQQVAQVQGGKIEVDSRVGEGSTFSVFLPLVKNN